MHIFISYAKTDTRDLALQLRDALTALPTVTAWMDTSLYSGEDWAVQIQDEIDRADLVVVILSEDVNRPATHAKGRSFVLKEIHYAQQVKKTIIPVMAQTTRVPVQMAGIEYIDFARNQSDGLQRIIREITTRAGIAVPEPLPKVAPSIPDPFGFSRGPSRLIVPPPSPPTRSLIDFAPYRRPALIMGLLTLLAIVLAVVALPALNRSSTTTPTANVVLLPSKTPIFTATASPTDGPAPTPTATEVPIPTTVSYPLGVPGNPVIHNIDWKPQYKTFNGFEMSLVPVGCFMMGSTEGSADEKPVNQQCFDQPFWIDRYEVTNKQYGSEGNFKGDKRPRESVTWFAARDFCVQRGSLLPTEREWEYAARGPSNLVYPWGNDFVADNVVYYGNSNNQTADVGSRPAGNSWVGVSDLSGNVWEWVSSIYQPYPYKVDDGREVNSDRTDVSRILRGGSWFNNDSFVCASSRYGDNPADEVISYGFRCVRLY